MPRPKMDGTPARAPRRRKLTESFVRKLTPEPAAFAVWDTRAARRGDVIEQVRHWVVGSVLRDQFIATVGGSPIALAAANENGRALLVAQTIARDCATAMSTANYLPCARVR